MKNNSLEGKPTGQVVTFIAFDISGCLGIIEASLITGAKKCTSITPVPYAPPFLLGVTKHHDEILPILSVAGFFNKTCGPLTDESRILHLGRELTREPKGLLVDRIFHILSIPVSAIQNIPKSKRAGRRLLIRGWVEPEDLAGFEGGSAGTNHGSLYWIDIAAILDKMGNIQKGIEPRDSGIKPDEGEKEDDAGVTTKIQGFGE